MLREKFSGFLKNLLLLAVAPIGFLIFTGTTLWQLNKIHSEESGSTLAIFSTAAGWVIFMIIPYGSMLWRGKKEKDKFKLRRLWLGTKTQRGGQNIRRVDSGKAIAILRRRGGGGLRRGALRDQQEETGRREPHCRAGLSAN